VRWISRIKNALDNGHFRLHRQPIVALNQVKKVGSYSEILLRLVDDNQRLVLPSEFIPAAERYDQMGSVDRWVIAAAFDTLSTRAATSQAAWSINVSG
jgi:EAL domain-containing protein (putative c-di-GMP-specific phosphodiesterase class I)